MQAIAVRRRRDEPIDATELRGLAETAGYEVIETVGQRRAEDSTYHVGRGKAEELADLAAETAADAILVDDRVTPQQAYHLEELCPPETRVLGRYRLVLEIFADRATDRAAQLQVELAELRYERKRVRAALKLEEDAANERRTLGEFEASEQGEIKHVDERIEALESALESTQVVVEQRRERRSEQGFDHVAVAGYTNAGKSTLLRRLADDEAMTHGSRGANDDPSAPSGDPIVASEDQSAANDDPTAANDANSKHDDLAERVTVEDRLFETLETTTRRATIEGRRVLLTDTVGVVSDLPHWLVRSFRSTLRAVGTADAVLLVLDASAPVDRFETRLATAIETLTGRTDAPVLPVLNKVDATDEGTVAERREQVRERLPETEPIAISALAGSGIDTLGRRLDDALPAERVELTLPNCSATMGLVSKAYDELSVADVSYEGDTVELLANGHPAAVERLRGQAEELPESPAQ
ncbi:GTP-binding protein HflX [Salinarchaeum sp. Harcht-Bsk1]|uniref:HflX GTPase family protein n=1 Tax=Salinarchaeum sp. Harcht-Bsk1 TaxID=1333523 RepID=UPI0003422CD8|nr:GTPase [Salinarchaeum sp. Harcht-Bsk1]AGN00406.1 GTP-binding protein HflX [Salinarchaeum sp. Harcht-Bsk1]